MTSLKLNMIHFLFILMAQKYAIWNLLIYPELWCHRQQTGEIYRNVMLFRALR